MKINALLWLKLCGKLNTVVFFGTERVFIHTCLINDSNHLKVFVRGSTVIGYIFKSLILY